MKIVPEIKDRYVLNAGVFYLLGIMVVVPFQFYINSLDFWMYKFKPPPPPPPRRPPGPGPTHPGPPLPPVLPERSVYFQQIFNKNILHEEYETRNITTTARFVSTVTSEPDDDDTKPGDRTPIQANFTAGFNITFKFALLGALLICSFWSQKLPPPEKRLKFSLISLCIMFSINTLATQINSRQMVEWFFAGAMFFATLMNFCTGMAMASLYELISKFPPSYYASIQSGHNICGIISSFLQVCLLSARLPPNDHGSIYFACGTFILIVTTIYYIHSIKNSKYFIYKISQGEHRRLSKIQFAIPSKRKRVTELLLKIKWYYATLIFAEGTTHIVYPGLAALVVPLTIDNGRNAWKEVYFVPVITFLGFQVCMLIGRETARIIKTPKHGIVLFILAALRIILVPLLIFCNALPRSRMPVLFDDNGFIGLIAVLAFSEGVLMNMAIVAIPTILEKDDREAVMVLVPLVSSVTVTLASALNVFINNLL